ncbi:uncharacterized protein [Hyperolius riggenbachi]|uniref:uncharacterized protein isoform X2 n=1 Tax=Hyperolius riggenbachi TaxID=752182 RepID=UPI0035A3896C
MAGTVQDKDAEYEDSAEEDLNLNLSVHLLPSEKLEERHRDHCDYLLDAIDEQLDQLQSQTTFKASVRNNDDTTATSASDMEHLRESSSQEPKEPCTSKSGEQRDSEIKKDEYKWRLAQLLGSEEAESQEYQSDFNSAESVCTEDFAVKFSQGMVAPIVCSVDNEEQTLVSGKHLGERSENLTLSLPLFEGTEDQITLNTARREDILQQFKEELEGDLQTALTFSVEDIVTVKHRTRRDSLESLGGQISKLSQVQSSEPSSIRSLERSSVSHLSSNNDFKVATDNNAIVDRLAKYPEEQSRIQSMSSHDASLYFSKGNMDSNIYSKSVCLNSGTMLNAECDQDLTPQMDPLDAGRIMRSEHMERSYAKEFAKMEVCASERAGSSGLSSYGKTKDEPSVTALPVKTSPYAGREVLQRTEEATKLHSHLDTCGIFSLRSNEDVPPNSFLKEDSADFAGYKHVAGVPVKSFDAVTVDSDLDSVTTERVRDHIRKALSSSKRDPGHSNRKGHRGRDGCVRYTGSSKVSTDDEEDFDRTFTTTEWRNESPKRWSSSPLKPTDSSRDRSAKDKSSDFLSSTEQMHNRRLTEKLTVEREILEGTVAKLRREAAFEEERLSQRKVQYQEADQHFNDVLQQKKEAYHELESLRDLLEKTQKEVMKMETHLRESQMTEEDFRRELVIMEYKRGEYMKELQELELELESVRQQCSSTHSSQIASFQYEISSLTTERDELRARIRHLEGSMSFMERQELERQLSNTRSELFSEQRTARAKIEKLQENLEDSQCKLEETRADCAEKQEKNKQLKSQLRELEKKYEMQFQTQEEESSKQQEAFNEKITDLSAQVTEQSTRIASLEKILSEKELDLLRLRDVISSIKAEKEAQALATEVLKEEHNKRLTELQIQHHQDREMHIAKMKEEMQSQKQNDLQQFAENMENLKAKALQDQAELLKKEMDKVENSLEMKDKEITKMKDALKSQKETMKKLAADLKQEARELVHSALLREQKKWEGEKRDALQIQRHTLEEEKLRDLADLREALERERRTSMALEKKLADLQNIIQEHEIQQRALQREKQEALEELRALLKEEKQEELRRLEHELTQEKERDIERLKNRLQEMEEEQRVLRAEKNEAVFREREALAQSERAERALAREISAACERIQCALGRPKIHSPSRSKHGSPSRLSTNQALQMLHGVSEETNQLIHELQQEAEAQKRTVLHVQREKEREMQQLKEQLQIEKEKALELLKERLIQEHIEEITNLQRDQLRESGGPESQSLKQQLREKDNELRAIQRNMAKWKDETATKLARKFEEELNGELEKSLSRSKASESHRNPERAGSAIRRLSLERREIPHLRSASSPSLNGVTPQHDFSALKILRNLQGRVRELRSDNRAHHGGSMEDLTMLRTDLGTSYRDKRPVIMERSLSGGLRK